MDSASRAQEAPRRVLIVDDNPGDARLLRESLRVASRTADDIANAATLSETLEQLRASDFDVILLDLSLPDSQGLETVQRVHAQSAGVPIIVLTGLDDEDTALAALKAGAQDYILKGECSGETIRRAVHYAIERQKVLLELERTRDEQLRMKDHFLSLVSHELRTPLNNLCLSVSNVAEGLVGEVTPEQREMLELALRSAGQLTRMVGDILDVTRADMGKLSINVLPTDLEPLLRDIVHSVEASAHLKRIAIALSIAPGLPAVSADPGRLRQVVLNLLDNAVKFSPSGGRVTLRAARTSDSDEICVDVADDGPGISADAVRRVFERFYQESTPHDACESPGLGLGLYICRQLVHRMGGAIWVESQPGKGCVFRFTVPAATVADPAHDGNGRAERRGSSSFEPRTDTGGVTP